MSDELFCPFCKARMIAKLGILRSCVSAPENRKLVSIECEKGCIKTRQYSSAKKAIEAGKRLVYFNQRVITKAIETPRPLFSQEAYS